jgi:hypothetical protein
MAATLLALILALLTVVPAGAAQHATPEASPVATGCQLARRTPAAVIESAGTNPGEAELPGPIPYAIAEGYPIDAETGARVNVLLDAFVDCVNRGDLVGFLSLFSDGFLRRHFGSFDVAIDDLDTYELDPMPPDELLELSETRDVTRLLDGRISVLVLLHQGEELAPELTSVLILTERNGQLVIDEWQPVTLDDPSAPWQIVSGDGYRGAIVPADEVADYVTWLKSAVVQGTWTPTAEQISELEARLPGFLQTLSSAAPDLDDRLPEYTRHYMGYVEDGHAYILVNLFCTDPGENGLSEPVIGMDGGDCFFYVVWDPTALAFTAFMANGEA